MKNSSKEGKFSFRLLELEVSSKPTDKLLNKRTREYVDMLTSIPFSRKNIVDPHPLSGEVVTESNEQKALDLAKIAGTHKRRAESFDSISSDDFDAIRRKFNPDAEFLSPQTKSDDEWIDNFWSDHDEPSSYMNEEPIKVESCPSVPKVPSAKTGVVLKEIPSHLVREVLSHDRVTRTFYKNRKISGTVYMISKKHVRCWYRLMRLMKKGVGGVDAIALRRAWYISIKQQKWLTYRTHLVNKLYSYFKRAS